MLSPSVVATVPWNGCGTPCAAATASTSPIACSTAAGGSSSRPKVSARIEQHLGVGLALDLRVQRRVDGEDEVALDRGELVDVAVVHEQPAAMAEWVAVGLLHGAADRRADVGEEQRGADVAGELAQVAGRSTPVRCCGRRRGCRGRRTSRRRSRRRWSAQRRAASAGSGRRASWVPRRARLLCRMGDPEYASQRHMSRSFLWPAQVVHLLVLPRGEDRAPRAGSQAGAHAGPPSAGTGTTEDRLPVVISRPAMPRSQIASRTPGRSGLPDHGIGPARRRVGGFGGLRSVRYARPGVAERGHPRAVAQLGSAPRSGRGGRRFKSCQPDQSRNVGNLDLTTTVGVGPFPGQRPRDARVHMA